MAKLGNISAATAARKPKFLPIKDAAPLYGLSKTAMRQRRSKGTIPARCFCKSKEGTVAVDIEEMDTFMRSNKEEE